MHLKSRLWSVNPLASFDLIIPSNRFSAGKKIAILGCLSICLSVYLSACLFICLSAISFTYVITFLYSFLPVVFLFSLFTCSQVLRVCMFINLYLFRSKPSSKTCIAMTHQFLDWSSSIYLNNISGDYRFCCRLYIGQLNLLSQYLKQEIVLYKITRDSFSQTYCGLY